MVRGAGVRDDFQRDSGYKVLRVCEALGGVTRDRVWMVKGALAILNQLLATETETICAGDAELASESRSDVGLHGGVIPVHVTGGDVHRIT